MCSLWNFANDRIRTVDLWYPKQPLCERSHNHCPGHLHCQNFNLFCLRNENKRKRGRELHILEGHKLEQMFSNKTKIIFFLSLFSETSPSSSSFRCQSRRRGRGTARGSPSPPRPATSQQGTLLSNYQRQRPLYTWTCFQYIIPPFLMHLIT